MDGRCKVAFQILFILSHFPGTAIQCLPGSDRAPANEVGSVRGAQWPSSYEEAAHLGDGACRSRDSRPKKKTVHCPFPRQHWSLAQPSQPRTALSKLKRVHPRGGWKTRWATVWQESASIVQTTPTSRLPVSAAIRQTFCHTLAARVPPFRHSFVLDVLHISIRHSFLASAPLGQLYFNFLLASEIEIAPVKARAAVASANANAHANANGTGHHAVACCAGRIPRPTTQTRA